MEQGRRTAVSLARLLPRLEARFSREMDPEEWRVFTARLSAHFEGLFAPLLQLYGGHYDFFYHLEEVVATAAQSWLARPAPLRELDAARECEPGWIQDQRMMGAMCYVDLFAGNLQGMAERVPYLEELGITYLHLMPLFLAPEGDSDGGYAVSSYREVNPALGSMAQLAELATTLRAHGISLVLDFVFNHTSNEHEWARRALAGERSYQEYYLMFPDRTLPDAYQRHLRDIFPQQRPGSFTYRADLGKWVWTTFHSYQWDLNYGNPAVFRQMGEEMLFLANQGVEILRLDAVAFAWKQLGTPCESLPQVHLLVRAFNALARIAAPALLFKSEAIVHPDQVADYIRPDECQISYNPLLMALQWEALATREVRLLQLSMREHFRIDPRCAWVNYVRSHDDIGWTFDDHDAWRLGIDPYWHRRFLNDFYTGRFPGSFARGLPFQENPRTGDARISGTTASLAGLEKGVAAQDQTEILFGIRKILLLYGMALSMGGIPLLYLGDELGTLNDYGYVADPAMVHDSRWVHRPPADAARIAERHETTTIPGMIFAGLVHLIEARKRTPALAGGETEVIDSGNGAVFGYVRRHESATLLALVNVSEREQRVAVHEISRHLLGHALRDLVSDEAVTLYGDLALEPYRFVWLTSAPIPHAARPLPAR